MDSAPMSRPKLKSMAATVIVAAMAAFALALLVVGLAQLAGLSANGPARDLCALTLIGFLPCLAPASRIGPALIARYDDQVLRVTPAAAVDLTAADGARAIQPAAWRSLQQWCCDGAGDGRAPLMRPWAMPRVERRFAIAVLSGEKGAGKAHLVEAFSREIDGSNQLQRAGGAFGRLALRLRVKLNDCLWWRARQPTDPWDSGYLIEDAALRGQLQQFVPRRATLIVAAGFSADALRACIAALSARSAKFQHPVRLLIVGAEWPRELGAVRVIAMAETG